MAFDPEDKIKWEELAPSLQNRFNEMEKKIADAIKNLNDVLAKTLTEMDQKIADAIKNLNDTLSKTLIEIDKKVNDITTNINMIVNDVPVTLDGDVAGMNSGNYDRGSYGYSSSILPTFGSTNCIYSQHSGWGRRGQCAANPIPNRGTFKLMDMVKRMGTVSHYHRMTYTNCNCSSSH